MGAQIISDYSIIVGISNCRDKLFPASDTLSLFLVNQFGQAGSAEAVVARLNCDWVDHDMAAEGTSNLFLQIVHKLFGLLIVLCSFDHLLVEERQFEADGLLLADFADRQQPNFITVFDLLAVVFSKFLRIEIGAVCAEVSKVDFVIVSLQKAVFAAEPFLMDDNFAVDTTDHNLSVLERVGGQPFRKGDELSPNWGVLLGLHKGQ